MAKTEEAIRVVMLALKEMGPDGENAVDELQRHFDRVLLKSGGEVDGVLVFSNVKQIPVAIFNKFQMYQRQNGDTIELVSMDPNGDETVLDSYTA